MRRQEMKLKTSKLLLISLAAIIFIIPFVSAEFNLEWASAHSSSEIDAYGVDMAAISGGVGFDPDQNIYVVGGGSGGGSNFWVAKFNPTATNIIWVVQPPKVTGWTGFDDDGGSLLVDGNSIIATGQVGQMGAIFKLDFNGNVLWSAASQSPGFCGQTVSDDNYYYVACDYVLVKIDKNGNVVKRVYPAPTKTWMGLSFDNDGNLINSGLDYSEPARCYLDKYDTNFNIIWQRTYRGNDWTGCGRSIADSNYIYESGQVANGPAGGQDALLLKYDYNGNLIWNKTYGGSGTDGLGSPQELGGGLLLTGQKNSKDVWIAMLDKDGGLREETVITGASNRDNGNVIAKLEDKFILLAKVNDVYSSQTIILRKYNYTFGGVYAPSDIDEDGYPDAEDNCPNEYNPDQANADGDATGDVCDPCPSQSNDGCLQSYTDGQSYNPLTSTTLQSVEVQVTVPPGAITEEVSLSMQRGGTATDFEICASRTTCFTAINQTKYSFEPEITFDQPIEIKFSYAGAPAATYNNCLLDKCDIFWMNESSNKWVPQKANCSAEPGWCVLSVTYNNAINHFSEYMLMEQLPSAVGIEGFIAKAGDTKDAVVSLASDYLVGGFQYTLNLPNILTCNNYNTVGLSNENVAFNNQIAGKVILSLIADALNPISPNQGEIINMQCSVSPSAADGVYSLDMADVIIGDEKGVSLESKAVDSSIIIDSTPPVVTVTGIPIAWRNIPVAVYINCNDATSGCVSIKYGTSVNAGSCVANQNYLGSGIISENTYICYNASDAAGNSAAGSVYVNYFDSSAPVTTAIYNSSTKLVTLNVVDSASGVMETGYCIDLNNSCSPASIYTGPVNIAQTIIAQNGQGYIRYQSIDYAGNIEQVKSLQIIYDITPPEGVLTVQSGGGICQ